jgi:hypothetical protein
MKKHFISLLVAMLLMVPITAHAIDDCIMMENGKMMLMKDGQSMPMAKEMVMPNGAKIMEDGTVMMKNGKKMKMTNEMMMDMKGNMMVKDGAIMKDGKMMTMKDGNMMPMDNDDNAQRHQSDDGWHRNDEDGKKIMMKTAT